MANLKDISVGTIAGDDPKKQIEGIIKQLNEWGREISNEGITKIYKDDAGTQRVLLGKGADGFQGVKVSQEGSDVFTAEDDELVMSSNFNSFKIVDSGTISLDHASPATYVSTSIAHNQSEAPIVVAFVGDSTNGYFPVPNIIINPTSGIVDTMYRVWSSDTDIVFEIFCSAAGINDTVNFTTLFRYYLLVETARTD